MGRGEGQEAKRPKRVKKGKIARLYREEQVGEGQPRPVPGLEKCKAGCRVCLP